MGEPFPSIWYDIGTWQILEKKIMKNLVRLVISLSHMGIWAKNNNLHKIWNVYTDG